jgi:3-hydroxybutyryl-CoA dehydrogenase
MTEVKQVGVIGAGQMGAGIACVLVASGYKTLLTDESQDSLARGVAYVEAQLKKALEKEKITKSAADTARSLLAKASTAADLKNCDFVIEAIIENAEIKLQLFKTLDNLLPAHSIIASNTSSISITKLAAATKRPQQIIGMHFMNPVPVMQLVELIRGLQTSDETYATTKALAEKLGKTTVLAVDNAGFIVNRILVPMINEAIYLIQEGVLPQDIDTAMKLGTNQPMGPLALADFVGLDTLLSIMRILHKEIGEDKYRPCPLLVKYVEAGWYGKKSGRGFYRYGT